MIGHADVVVHDVENHSQSAGSSDPQGYRRVGRVEKLPHRVGLPVGHLDAVAGNAPHDGVVLVAAYKRFLHLYGITKDLGGGIALLEETVPGSSLHLA